MMHDALTLIRNPNCEGCKLCDHTDYVCEMGVGPTDTRVVVVSRMPNSDNYQADLEADLEEAGLDAQSFYYTAALKCRTFDVDASNADIKACRSYLEAELELLKPQWVLAFGNEALLSTTGHSGIMSYRGKPVDRGSYKVFPTISPASVRRNPGQRQGYIADLLLFNALLSGQEGKYPPPKIFVVDTHKKVKQLARMLDKAELLSYDVETRSDSRMENDPRGVLVSLAGTTVMSGGKLFCWALPLSHPESVWKTQWRSLLRFLAPHLERVPRQVAHNGKFDARWMRKFGVRAKVTFDTMIGCNLLDENRQKGLKPQAASRLGVAPWAIDTKDLWLFPIRQVLKYNCLDTYYTYFIYLQIKDELMAQPRLLRIFTKILMPANEEFIEAEMRGAYIDRERLATRHKIAIDTRAMIDQDLMQWVPSPQTPESVKAMEEFGIDEAGWYQEIGWPTLGRRGKLAPVNFNPTKFMRWLLFEYLELPVVARGKPKPDGSPGDPSMAEAVMLELKGEHPIVEKLLERVTWQKFISSFFGAYEELLDDDSRIHTSFKLTGTVTGRLSSGKEEADKITARASTRGVNLQQVPRDPFIRGLFGVPPGYTFVEVDFSQVELRVVAFLSRDRTMMRLYQTGQDIHRATAAWVLGIPASKVSKDDRKKAKAVNFGFVYGMGAPKFVSTAFEKYEVRFTLDEAKAIRKEYFSRFRGLLPWHARMRRLAHEFGRVQSPIGRLRRLPDIRSGDDKVVGEAERQAINSPVQSFASDMNLLGMIETCKLIRAQDLDASVIGTVHDATLWEVKDEHLKDVIPLIKHTYENLPLRKKFGVVMDVPIVADLKVGEFWGDAQEMPEGVAEDADRLREWIEVTEGGRKPYNAKPVT